MPPSTSVQRPHSSSLLVPPVLLACHLLLPPPFLFSPRGPGTQPVPMVQHEITPASSFAFIALTFQPVLQLKLRQQTAKLSPVPPGPCDLGLEHWPLRVGGHSCLSGIFLCSPSPCLYGSQTESSKMQKLTTSHHCFKNVSSLACL